MHVDPPVAARTRAPEIDLIFVDRGAALAHLPISVKSEEPKGSRRSSVWPISRGLPISKKDSAAALASTITPSLRSAMMTCGNVSRMQERSSPPITRRRRGERRRDGFLGAIRLGVHAASSRSGIANRRSIRPANLSRFVADDQRAARRPFFFAPSNAGMVGIGGEMFSRVTQPWPLPHRRDQTFQMLQRQRAALLARRRRAKPPGRRDNGRCRRPARGGPSPRARP